MSSYVFKSKDGYFLTKITEGCVDGSCKFSKAKIMTEDELVEVNRMLRERGLREYYLPLEVVDGKEPYFPEELEGEDDEENERNYMRAEAQNRELTEDERIIYGLLY